MAQDRASGRVEAEAAEIERRTQRIGRRLLAETSRGGSMLSRAWWDDRLMDLTMSDTLVKVQLFRFIDALPALTGSAAVRRHLDDYLAEAGDRVPGILRAPLSIAPSGRWGDALIARIAHFAARRMAGRFIAGNDPAEVRRTVLGLRHHRRAFTADLLGEAVITENEADAYAATCRTMLGDLAAALRDEPEIPRIDRDDHGPIPRMNLSLKLTSLVPRFDALHAETTAGPVLERLRVILREARALGAFVNVDMEQYAHKTLTIELFQTILDEPEFRDWPDAGIVVQAYQPEALGDLEHLRDWSGRRGTPVTVRLVKGAYWDYETLHARQQGWPAPVFGRKWETDANYERCADFLLEHRRQLRPAFAGHNVRSLSRALARAEAMGVPREAIEIQMLYGMGGALEQALVDRGLRVRVYTPFGAMLPGMAYLVRRLLENTSNESFLRASSSGGEPSELLRDPLEVGAMWEQSRQPQPPKDAAEETWPPFSNEPLTDFTRPANRDAMRAAVERVRDQLDTEHFAPVLRPYIGGQHDTGQAALPRSDPGKASRVVSVVHNATVEEARAALAAARAAQPAWGATPARQRAAVLRRAAALMRRERFELAAWEVFECAKPWREADADVAEAIDFCEFYAREMIRLAAPDHRDVPGETNAIEHIPRGVVVVIPPWNFPLAIPCGMTVAALVTGNSVVLKPAEQSPVMAWHLTRILMEAGVPPGALNYLPGIGEEVGPILANSPEVDVIAFTGSRPVGLLLNRQAAESSGQAEHVKRVIAEMGGKNAIIVAEDADPDEAVVGVLQSAFGYAGQKCSACSRLIVLDAIRESFLDRLVQATRTLPVGHADDPDTVVNPLIDADARKRVDDYIRLARQEGRVLLEVDPGPEAGQGNYVGPLIVADVDPSSRLAQEEIFGPVLTVLRARDMDEALRIANGTPYALTGGLYARGPATIERVRRDFRVGNLYINRPCTGALVDRQPFGGFKMSGIGTKAGGADYLREFLLTRVITENTMRRGFAPEEPAETPPAAAEAAVAI